MLLDGLRVVPLVDESSTVFMSVGRVSIVVTNRQLYSTDAPLTLAFERPTDSALIYITFRVRRAGTAWQIRAVKDLPDLFDQLGRSSA